MSISYHPIKAEKRLCRGPNNELTPDSSPLIKIERGNHLGKIVLFSVCGYRIGEGNCKLSKGDNISCKYFGKKAESEINRILDSNK